MMVIDVAVILMDSHNLMRGSIAPAERPDLAPSGGSAARRGTHMNRDLCREPLWCSVRRNPF
jgi:hypothetical protein